MISSLYTAAKEMSNINFDLTEREQRGTFHYAVRATLALFNPLLYVNACFQGFSKDLE